MNVQTFMNHYAPHLMTDFSEEMNTLLSDEVFRSQMEQHAIRITPHPFEPGETAILLDQRGGTFLHKLEEWEKNPHARLQVVTGMKQDPNSSWIESVEWFLKHERLYRKYPDLVNEFNTNLETGYVAVYCSELPESNREVLLDHLLQEGYVCTVNCRRKRLYLTWREYRELNISEACRFIDTYQQLIKGAI